MSDCTLSGNPPYDCSGCDLTGRNLAGKDLTNAKFQGATLTGTIFQGAKSLAGANFTGAVLYGTDFSGCDLSAAIFGPSPRFSLDPSHPTKFIRATIPFATLGKVWNNLDLTNADITGLPHDLSQLQASGAVLPGFCFAGRNLDNAHFIGSKLMGAHFCNAQLNNAVFTGLTDLTGAKFLKCPLSIAVFDTATLTRVDFTGAVMNGVSLQHTRMDGTVFDGVDVTSCSFSQPPRFSSDPSNLTSFRGATLNYSTILKTWTCLDLTGATLVGLDATVDLTRLQAQYTKLGVLDLSGFSLANCDFTGATLSGTKFINAKLGLACFDGATGPATHFDGALLENATFQPNPANSTPAVFHTAIFNNADLTNASFHGANLTGAWLIDASLHGATLTNTKLPGANLTGSQLGSLGHLFTLPSSAEAALNAGQVSVLAPFFKQNGITLSSNVTIETLAPNRVWQLNDAGNHVAYTIRLQTQSGNTQVLTVYAPVLAASLVNAYLPNATLTGANLYGTLANDIQFYGSNARIDGSAILEAAQLNNSNFSNLNLTQAELLGANLSGSHLFNGKFNKANLTPSADGVAANLSDANLQGADFTDALLYGANLSNAAIAVKVPTTAVPLQGGVYLFSLPYSGDTNTLQQYTAELNAAASKFSLNPEGDQAKLQQYVSALKANELTLLKLAFLKHQPPIVLSNNAQIQTVEVGDIWQIVDGAQSYTLWTDQDENGKTELYAAPSLTKTQAAFHQNNMTLRWQASAAIDKANQQWLLDNDSENPQNFSTGYVKFIVQLNGSVLDVYGTAVRIERLGDNNQLQMDTETCNVTVIAVTNMNGETICPNGTKLSANQKTGGVQWDTKWLRATSPPKPPTCVPTDYNWCPVTGTSMDSAPDFGGDVCPDFNTALN